MYLYGSKKESCPMKKKIQTGIVMVNSHGKKDQIRTSTWDFHLKLPTGGSHVSFSVRRILVIRLITRIVSGVEILTLRLNQVRAKDVTCLMSVVFINSADS